MIPLRPPPPPQRELAGDCSCKRECEAHALQTTHSTTVLDSSLHRSNMSMLLQQPTWHLQCSLSPEEPLQANINCVCNAFC